MKINSKLKRQVQYELKQKNKTNIKFSEIESMVDLNKNTFISQNKEILTFKYFTISSIVVIFSLIIIGCVFFNNFKRILMEKDYQLRLFQMMNITNCLEKDEYKAKMEKQNELIIKNHMMNQELEKEIAMITGEGNPEQIEKDGLDLGYQCYDGLTLQEKKENIFDEFVVAFHQIEKIQLNEREYINIYLNTKWSNDYDKKILAYKPFLDSNNQYYEVSFLIHSIDSSFVMKDHQYTNVCNFQLIDDVLIDVNISVKFKNEVIFTKDIQIGNNKESK